MRKLLFLAACIGVLGYFLYPQWLSLEEMGVRRFAHMDRPQKELVVGVSWPISVRQDGMVAGIELAKDEINAQHYPGVPPIRLIIRDDRDDWKYARRIAMEFARNPDMAAVIGYDEDGIGMQASSILETSRLLHMVINANNRAMTMHGFKYIVRTVQSTDQIARFLSTYSPTDKPIKKYAMVWEDDAYGQAIIYQYRIAQESLGGQLVYQSSYASGNPDFRLTVNQLKGVDADVILFSGQDAYTALFLKKAVEVGLKTPILVASDLTQDLIDKVGTYAKNAYFLGLYDVASPTPQNRRFVAAFRARYGRDPDTSAVQAYDALHILAAAVRTAKTTNPLDISYTIRFRPYWVGANGVYRFDENGELKDKPLFRGRYDMNSFKKMPPISVPRRDWEWFWQ